MEYVFVSSWSHGNERGGISQYGFCPETGEMTHIKTLSEDKSCNASFLDEKRGVLYVLNESSDLSAMRVGGGGEILAYRLNKQTGAFEWMDSKPTYCANPVQLSMDATGKYMIIAHHATRSYVTKIEKDENGKYQPVVLFDDSAIELWSIHDDGSLGELLDVVKHTGQGPGARQTNAHPHSATISPSGSLFAVCDKGSDVVCMYKIDRENNKLARCEGAAFAPAGSMPRYCVFHPTQPWFYHNNEGNADIQAYRYDEDGGLEWKGTYHALEEKLKGIGREPVEQQGLCIDKAGRFLYSVVRGPNQVAVFEINQADGALTLIQNMPIDFEWPRGMALSSDGKFLVVTCLKGQKIVVLRVGEDGKLSFSGFEYHQPCAAYATFGRI